MKIKNIQKFKTGTAHFCLHCQPFFVTKEEVGFRKYLDAWIWVRGWIPYISDPRSYVSCSVVISTNAVSHLKLKRIRMEADDHGSLSTAECALT